MTILNKKWSTHNGQYNILKSFEEDGHHFAVILFMCMFYRTLFYCCIEILNVTGVCSQESNKDHQYAHCIWWSNQEPSACPQPTTMQYQENHKIKSKLAQKLCVENTRHMLITKPIVNQFFVHLTKQAFCFHFSKILLFYKLICTPPWGQISHSRVDDKKLERIVDDPYWQ